MPLDGKNILTFQNYHKRPYIIYSDFESFKIRKIEGPKLNFKKQPMQMTNKDWQAYNDSKICHICCYYYYLIERYLAGFVVNFAAWALQLAVSNIGIHLSLDL